MMTSATHVLEYVRTLSPEEKQLVMVELIQEGIKTLGGETVMPVRTLDGESFGYYVPPAVANQHLQMIRQFLSPQQLERTQAAFANLDDTFDLREFMAKRPTDRPETPDQPQ